jgi:hypothetical protein
MSRILYIRIGGYVVWVKQQSRHFSIDGDGQHASAGVNVDGSIADRIFGLLDVVREGTNNQKE